VELVSLPFKRTKLEQSPHRGKRVLQRLSDEGGVTIAAHSAATVRRYEGVLFFRSASVKE